jgi:hypothetical protein
MAETNVGIDSHLMVFCVSYRRLRLVVIFSVFQRFLFRVIYLRAVGFLDIAANLRHTVKLQPFAAGARPGVSCSALDLAFAGQPSQASLTAERQYFMCNRQVTCIVLGSKPFRRFLGTPTGGTNSLRHHQLSVS